VFFVRIYAVCYERLRGVITTRRYTNPRLPYLPYLMRQVFIHSFMMNEKDDFFNSIIQPQVSKSHS